MTHLIDKDRVVAEIKRRMDENRGKQTLPQYFGMIEEDLNILSFIDTIEVKEVNLEEKATQLSQKYFPDEENIWARPNIEAQKCKSACIEMVEWFKAQKGK